MRGIVQIQMMIAVTLLFNLIFVCQGGTASAGTSDRFGNNAEVLSLSVSPDLAPTRTYPEITSIVQNSSAPNNGAGGKASFDVIVSLTLPNGTTKSLMWHETKFNPNQRKSFAMPKSFDNAQEGTYTITYAVYNITRTHLFAKSVKTFTLFIPAPAEDSAQLEKTLQQPFEKSPLGRRAVSKKTVGAQTIGLGVQVNTLNFSAGPSLIVWPFRNLALQATYGIGTFTSYEARIFYRFAVSRVFNPYCGAGYLHAERKTNVLGGDTTIPADSGTAFVGIETRLNKQVSAYIDVSGTPLKMKKDISSGGTAATVTVTYTPVTVNAGVVWYFF